MRRRALPPWLRASRALALDRIASAALRRSPIIVMYHGVAADPLPHRKFFPEDEFVAHLDAIARGFNTVSMTQIADWLEGDKPLPPRAIALTFDDGYANLLDRAVPEMCRRGISATIYATSLSLSDAGGLLWFDEVECSLLAARDLPPTLELAGHVFEIPRGEKRHQSVREVVRAMKTLAHSDRERVVDALRRAFPCDAESRRRFRLLDRDQIRALPAQGMEVGGHTARHVILAREDAEVQRREIVSNFDAISALTGDRPASFAYPNGRAEDVTPDTIRFARDAGYRVAVTTEAGIIRRGTEPFTIPRVSAGYLGAYGLGDRLRLLPLRIAVSSWAGS